MNNETPKNKTAVTELPGIVELDAVTLALVSGGVAGDKTFIVGGESVAGDKTFVVGGVSVAGDKTFFNSGILG